MDGLNPLYYRTGFNARQAEEAECHILDALASGLPELELREPNNRLGVIVGGAPTAKRYRDEIAAKQKAGAAVFAVNDIHDWLISEGIVPDGFLFAEVGACPMEVFTRQPHPEVMYYVSSMCHPKTREQLRGFNVTLWHCASAMHAPVFEKFEKMQVMGGSGTFHRTKNLMWTQGFRDFDIYGVEGSYDPKEGTHAIAKDRSDYLGAEIEIIAKSTSGEERKFTSRPYLVRQADEFRRHCLYHHDKFKLRMHGDGLLPWMHRSMFPGQYEVSNG